MKVMSTFIIVLIVVVSFGVAFRNSQIARTASEELNGERYSRMTAEENFENATAKVKTLEAEIARKDSKISALEKSDEAMKAMNEDLKGRLDKAAELKSALEGQIKELESLSSKL